MKKIFHSILVTFLGLFLSTCSWFMSPTLPQIHAAGFSSEHEHQNCCDVEHSDIPGDFTHNFFTQYSLLVFHPIKTQYYIEYFDNYDLSDFIQPFCQPISCFVVRRE